MSLFTRVEALQAKVGDAQLFSKSSEDAHRIYGNVPPRKNRLHLGSIWHQTIYFVYADIAHLYRFLGFDDRLHSPENTIGAGIYVYNSRKLVFAIGKADIQSQKAMVIGCRLLWFKEECFSVWNDVNPIISEKFVERGHSQSVSNTAEEIMV